jgi:hypothetical protein
MGVNVVYAYSISIKIKKSEKKRREVVPPIEGLCYL